MKSDVVVIGGGAMGSSVAWSLKSDPAFAGTVCVVERVYARLVGVVRRRLEN